MFVVALAFTVAATLAATCIGPVPLSPAEVLAVVARRAAGLGALDPLADQIVMTARLPRIGMALGAGAGLAVAGAVFQSLVRNPLADPYLLGLNSGASAAVAFTVLVAGAASALVVSGAALAGAVLTIAIVLGLAGGATTRGPARFVLAGLATGYALSAVTSLFVFLSDSPESARSVMFWLLGSLATVQPTVLGLVAGAVVIGVAWLVVRAGALDALASGDDSAATVGIDPERARFALLAGTSAMVGVVVSGVGGVGFIGLVVPHLARGLVGTRHRLLLPLSAVLGAGLLVIADTAARTALAPQEIPVGVVTGVIGAPFLVALLFRRRTDAV